MPFFFFPFCIDCGFMWGLFNGRYICICGETCCVHMAKKAMQYPCTHRPETALHVNFNAQYIFLVNPNHTLHCDIIALDTIFLIGMGGLK